jgi:hypothetical protein
VDRELLLGPALKGEDGHTAEVDPTTMARSMLAEDIISWKIAMIAKVILLGAVSQYPRAAK